MVFVFSMCCFYLFRSSWSWGTAENRLSFEAHHLVYDYHVAVKSSNILTESLKKN